MNYREELAEAKRLFGSQRHPVRKLRARTARLNAENAKKHPEPMFHFARRQDTKVSRPTLIELDAQDTEILKREATLGRIEKAARASAEWNNSDPFAYGRTALHVKQGYLDPEAVEREFRNRTLARQAAKRKEVDDAKGKTA
jgi:hypothetical protein